MQILIKNDALMVRGRVKTQHPISELIILSLAWQSSSWRILFYLRQFSSEKSYELRGPFSKGGELNSAAAKSVERKVVVQQEVILKSLRTIG
jgi:hypothetical protein